MPEPEPPFDWFDFAFFAILAAIVATVFIVQAATS